MRLTRESTESKALSWLRFPLAVLIVAIHTRFSDDHGNLAFYLGTMLSATIASIAVPTFFFISGYLFFANKDTFGRREYIATLRKKVKSLLLPYVIWNAIMYVLGILANLKYDIGWGDIAPWELYRIFWAKSDGYIATSVLGYRFSILCTPVNGPLWFVRDLMVAMILSPVIYWIIKKLRYYSMLLFLIVYFLSLGIPIKGFGLVALTFFPLGAAFSVLNVRLFSILSSHKKCVYIPAFFLAIASFWVASSGGQNSVLNKVYIIWGLFAALLFAYSSAAKDSLLTKRIIGLGETSFWIYVLHTTPVMNPLHKMLFHIGATYSETISYLLGIPLKVLLCLLSYYLMKRFMPKLLSVLVGGR